MYQTTKQKGEKKKKPLRMGEEESRKKGGQRVLSEGSFKTRRKVKRGKGRDNKNTARKTSLLGSYLLDLHVGGGKGLTMN